MMKKLKLFFACLLMAVLSIGQMWATDYELMLTLDVTQGAPSGSTSTALTNETLLSYLQGAAPATTDIISASLTGNVYKGKGSGGAGVPQECLKIGKASGAGSITFAIANTYDNVTKVEITGYGWKTSTAVSVNSSDAQSPTTALSEVTFSYEISGSKSITINSASSAFCATEIKLYKTKSGGTPTPSLSVAPTSIDFGTVEKGTSVSSEAIAVTFANLTGSVTYSGLTSPFTASGTVSATGDEITIAANTSNVGEYEQTLTIQSSADALSKTVTVTMNVVEPFDGLELTFPDYNDNGVGSYTATWTATKSGQVWTMANFNNNSNSWNLIKAGRNNNNTSVATITTQVENPVENVVVTISSVTAANVNSHKLYVADNASFTDAIEIDGDPATIAATNITYTVPAANRANDLYYKLEYDLKAGSSNGFLQISKLAYAYGTAAPQKQSTGLAYAVANHLVKVGASYEAPTLTNPNNLTGIAYASSDANIVSVDASTGALTIKAAGKAVITASREADDTYKTGSASYTVYVAAEAGTAADPLSEASAKALIDLGCTMEAHVHGTVLGAQDATKFTVTLAGGFQFYKLKDLGNVAFESAYIGNGDEVTAVGTLTKFNTTYELAEGCYLTAYTEYTEPLVDISNTKETAYTVAQALALAGNPTSDLTKAVYIAGVVYDVKSFNSTNGTLDIYIKDAGVENKFEFYKCAGIYDESLTAFTAADDVQVGDEVIGYGVMKFFSGGSIWEFDNTATGDYLVDLVRPEVAVSSVELDQNAASIEVNETVTLHATVNPDNASNKAITWSVQSGNTYASVADGVVTGLVAGEAVIRAASTADPTKYAECTVTVTAADPSKHVVTFDATTDTGDSPLSKSNITFTCSSGALDNESEYRLYKSSTTTFECSVGNIIKIEFTGVSGNPVSGFGDPEVGTLVTDGNNGVWTGNAASVSFVASGAQVRATGITVTYKEDNRAAAGLSWSTDAVVLTVGDAFTAPTLNNPNSIAANEITIASDNEDLAIVTAGVVSLKADATGEATITATFDGNEDYKPATVSYTITVNEAGLDNVTFDATIDIAGTSELSITKGGFTLEFTGGAMGNGSEYRLYKNETMKLSSTAYYIKKIEFTCTSGNPISGFADAEGLDKDNNQWTGQANSVELTASNAQVRIEKLKVYYIEDTRAAAGLAWNPADDIELTVGGAFSAPALLNPNGIDAAEISIASSNTDVATVTAGVVALVADATGEATITATFAGNASYKPATVSYKITVNPAYSIYVQPSLNVNFGSVNQNAEVADKSITVTLTGVDAATLTLEGTGASAFTISPAAAMTASGDITISASSANLGTFAATLTISDDANNAESKVVHLSLTVNEVVVPETPVSTTSEWVAATDGDLVDGAEVLIVGVHPTTSKVYAAGEQGGNNRAAVEASVDGEGVLTPGDNTMSFILEAQEGGKFALRTSNGKYLCAASSGNNYLRTQDVLDDNGKWTLTTTSAVANGSYTRNTMFFNSSSSLFACYASSTTTQQPIAFYVPKPAPAPEYETVRSGLEINRYYTVCLPKKVTAIKGASFWTLKSKSQDGATAYLEEETNNLPFAAGKPFIIQATAENLEVVYEGDATENAGTNGALHGTLVYMDAAALAAAGPGVYMLFSNELRPVGENNHLDANRAYVLLSELNAVAEAPQNAPGRRVVAMPMEKDVTTDINALNAAEAPVKIIIDGNLFILCGEKLYDATGRLVK